MRILHHFGPRSLLVAILVALVVGSFAWLMLPPVPRARIPVEASLGHLEFSRDFRYLACTEGFHESMRSWKGNLRVWDTQTQEMLFTIPYAEVYPPATDGGHSVAFTPDADKLVTYSWGNAKYYQMPGGEPWQPAKEIRFPHDEGRGTPSRLASDADGNLLVVFHERDKERVSVFDLWTGRELANWASTKYYPELFPGGAIEITEREVALARKLPSGKVHAQMMPLQNKPITFAASPNSHYRASTDCATLVHIQWHVRVLRDGVEAETKTPVGAAPALSPDGRLLAQLIDHGPDNLGWLAPLYRALGRRPGSFVLHDLTTGREVAQFPYARGARFSLDGTTLALSIGDSMDLYDVPVPRPWLRILGVAALAGGMTYGVGRLLGRRRKSTPKPTEATPCA